MNRDDYVARNESVKPEKLVCINYGQTCAQVLFAQDGRYQRAAMNVKRETLIKHCAAYVIDINSQWDDIFNHDFRIALIYLFG